MTINVPLDEVVQIADKARAIKPLGDEQLQVVFHDNRADVVAVESGRQVAGYGTHYYKRGQA